jgi:coenzyme F420 hydrogenase subunit beta
VKKSLSLKGIVDQGLCTGCGLCAAMAPENAVMAFNTNGYLRPRFLAPITPQLDNVISSICPGYNLKLEQTDGDTDVIWGPIVALRQGHATNKQVRFQGSSGGVLTALAGYLLESNKVNGVFQIRASEDEPTQNQVVLSRNSNDVLAAAGSRYAPSSPAAVLGSYLEGEGTYAVIAKPCDIAAIRQWMRVDDRVGTKFPYLLSFFCAGVPSRRGAEKIVEKLGFDEREVRSFRYRGNGWPGFATAVSKSGETRSMSYAKSWGDILSRQVQFRCKLCPDGTGEFADIVCADAWECDESGYPLFKEQEGLSIVLSRTNKGEKLVQQAMDQGVIALQNLPARELGPMQPGQLGRKRRVFARLLALRLAMRPSPRFYGLRLFDNARLTSFQDNVKNVLGTFKRVILRQDAS